MSYPLGMGFRDGLRLHTPAALDGCASLASIRHHPARLKHQQRLAVGSGHMMIRLMKMIRGSMQVLLEVVLWEFVAISNRRHPGCRRL